MKRKFFSKDLAQSSIETILIVAMALFILTALVGITYDQIYSFRADQSKKTASIAINSIVKEVNDVYFLGPGAMKTIIVRLPDGIDFNKSFIEDRTIWLNVFGSDVFATTSVDVRGIWPGEDGTFSFTITAYDDYVSISIRPVDVTPNSVNEYLVQGESKEFSITLHNGSDLDKYYLMVIDFPLSEVSLSSNHEDLIEVFYGETQLIDYSISCGLDSFGSYEGKIIFVPIDSSDENITIPVNLFCSSLQTKLKVYPSTKHFYTTTNSITSDSVLVCNTTSRDFSSSSASVSGSIAPYVVTSFSEPILANSCSTLNFVINAPSTVSSYLGSLSVGSGGYVAGVDLNLLTYSPSDAIRFSWDEAYFGIDGKSINDINLLVLVGPYNITQATVLFLNDIDDANVIGLYLSNQNTLPLNSKLSSGDWSTVSDFNLARRKSYDLNITFDANIRNDSEKFRIILKSSDGTYFWSPIFDLGYISDNNASHFSDLKKGQEPIYPRGDSLVSLWRMNDKNSTGWILNSASGQRDGELKNGADVNEIGLWDNNAAYFDGVNDYISNINTISSITDKFTVSAWIYPTRLTPASESYGNTIVATSSGYGVWLLHNNGKIRVYAFSTSVSGFYETAVAPVELNKWQHVTVSAIRGGVGKIYFNGSLIDSFVARDDTGWSGGFGIGDLRVNRLLTFKGKIDDVAVWNDILTDEEVREIYSIGSGVHDFNTFADGNGLKLANVGGSYVSDGNFYSRVFDFNGRVNFSQMLFSKSIFAPYLFFKDNNLNNNYSLNSFVYRKSDNSFTPTGELDSNTLDVGNELNSSSSLFDANLAGLWHLNDKNSGGWVLNSATGVRDASLNGGADVNAVGLWDTNAGYFDGANDYFVSPLKKTDFNQLSISMWVNARGAQSTKGIFQWANNLTSPVPWILFQRNSSSTVSWYIEQSYRITLNMNDNVWTNFVLTFDGTVWNSYTDGVFSGAYNGGLGIHDGNFIYLGNGYNGYFNGLIEEVAVWNRALSANEVNNLYISQKGNWLDNNLVGYWKFNSAIGTTVLDYARGNAGTLTGSGASINYKGLWDSNSFYGNGSSYYVNVPYSNTLKSTSFTFSLWINFTTSQKGKTLMGYHSDAGGGASIGIDDSTANLIKFHTNSYSTVLKSTTALNDGVWHNVVGTYSGGTSKLYVDGVLNNSRTGVPDPTINTNAFQIGKWVGGSQYFLGYIDEVKVYTRVLSAEEIAFDYNKILTSKFINSNTIDADSLVKWDSVKVNSDVNYSFGKEICGAGDLGCSPDKFNDGLVGLWHLNEAHGTTSVADSSGNGYDGTNNNAKVGLSITTSGSDTIYTFRRSGTFIVSADINVKVLVVAGGGGGGSFGGGGGAGGLLYNSALPVSAGTYPVTVGAGGAGATTSDNGIAGLNGANSVFNSLIAIGGGGGGTRYGSPFYSGPGSNGGSGGGSSSGDSGVKAASGTGVVGQGNNGGQGYIGYYRHGGGGGAGAVGADATSTKAGDGGVGLAYDISGLSVYYAGGGGGGIYTNGGTIGLGGLGGGGAGAITTVGVSGTANTGGGGGGGGYKKAGGAGGSGIVIIRVPTSQTQYITASDGLWGTNSANFDGATDYVSIPSINTGSGTGLTGCGWVKRFGALNNLAALFSFNNLKIRFASDGRIYDRAYNYLGNISSGYYSYNSIPLNKWTLVCVSYSSTGSNIIMDFYFNGVLDRSIVTDLSGLVGINSSGYIGMCQDVSSRKFSGFIEEASIWNRKLSNLEIIDLYRKGVSRLDLNVYSCSDSLCENKTSSKYISNLQNNMWIDFNLNLINSQYLGFDTFFKKASGLEDYNARNFWVSSFIKDINFIYSQGLINLYARSSANGYSWSDWSSALTSPQNDLSIFDGNYFQYKLFISSTSPSYSPILRDVNVTYNRISN